jgi:hypothetical protein
MVRAVRWLILILAGLALLVSLSNWYAPPQRVNDWETAFGPAILAWWTGANPYAVEPDYVSPPWVLLILAPLAPLPAAWAMTLPALALLYLSYQRRKPQLLILVGLSVPFIVESLYANIDWLVMLGVAIGGPLGGILDTVKPQAGVFAIVAEVARRKTWRRRALLLAPLILLALLTAPLWLDWLHGMAHIGSYQTRSLTSLYPRWLGLSVGAWACVWAWRKQSPLWGCVASLGLAPYWQMHSLLPLLFLVADRDWRAGVALNGTLWAVFGLIVAGVLPIAL